MTGNAGANDWIVAMFADAASATQVRVELAEVGIANDRLDVISWSDPGRAAVVPASDREDGLRKYFAMLFDGRADAAHAAQDIVAALKSGGACVVVLPRGVVEVREARRILDAHGPQKQYLSVAPLAQQGGLLGEHAAGG
jgi:hypothetical protein